MTETIVIPEAPAAGPDRPDYSPWLEAILTVARHYRLDVSPESIRLASTNSEGRVEEVVRYMARQAGLSVKFARYDRKSLSRWRTPLLVQLRDGQVGVIESVSEQGELGIAYSGDQGLQSRIDPAVLAEQALRTVILRPIQPLSDVRTDDYIKPYDEHWFRRIVLSDLRPYRQVMLASLVANLLGMAGVLFSMQVYDRVIPAESLPTLYVLFGGVMLALVFDFVMRIMRLRITDVLGKRADLRVSDLVFGHALRLRNSARPKSTGSFISQLRELEQIRDLITSSTATALADMPFFFLFLLVFYLIGGALVLIPLVALVAMVLPGVFAQRKLARLANASMREAALRNAMLVEAVQGMDDIKALQAEQRFQQQWNHYNAASADSSLKLRSLTNSLVAWTQNVQGAVFAVVIVFGAPMVIGGDLTTGSLVAASMLASRMMAPMAQLTHVLTRWQQAKVALQGLNRLMQMPVDHPEGSQRVHMPAIRGDYVLRQAGFKYSEEASPALSGINLNIRPGERVAILGRNGAGKSTLLQALAGSMDLSSGETTVDGISLAHLDPADLRRDVGLMSQQARLFHGTLRDNLTLGAGQASDQEIIAALSVTGALEFVRQMPKGMDHLILEGGLGLSGGQRQSLLLSRLLIRQPQVLLLDEPTASLDDITERQLLEKLSTWCQGRTLIVATHRVSLLQLVERIIVLDNGRIVIDDHRDAALTRLRQPQGAQA
ncbi:type I secretion system permease/ATPase [Pseudomonas sp. CFBP 13711]|uniref:type I secretion system permease/ATPase n=1 Tax=unclassified Pseudomonas TaxID=196821 RepID=UPI00177C219C|nr:MULTISPECIES: type I secretion system permease/ATPase [unclassified Pseudomonas]MBD8708880.1 type I secretion system permease/ATPase [Pseudomonas sp. CFBP 13711]MBD8712276.1 type I secretion system permease/ATPase [Pseudomonas sp. CFBP 13715]